MTAQTVSTPAIVDLRQIVPPQRHPLVFSTFRGLEDGEAMELVNDHDPSPLRLQFEALVPGRFRWDLLEAGPATWRVAITRLAPAPGTGRCCGGCGCA